MDENRMTPRTALFAAGMLGIYGLYVAMSRSKNKRLKVIVYHDPSDAFFADFYRGLASACDERGLTVEYVSISTDLDPAVLERTIYEHVVRDRTSDYFVVRVPSRRVTDALVRSGRPFATVMSPVGTVAPGESATDVGTKVRAKSDEIVLTSDAFQHDASLLDRLWSLRDAYRLVTIVDRMFDSKEIVERIRQMGYRVRRAVSDGTSNGAYVVRALVSFRPYRQIA
jgi:hypothetical protein